MAIAAAVATTEEQTQIRPQIDLTLVEAICAALREGGRDDLALKLENRRAASLRDARENAYLGAARDCYGSDDLEFDDDAVVSISEDQGGEQGAFVMGWRYVSIEEAGLSREDEDLAGCAPVEGIDHGSDGSHGGERHAPEPV